MKLNHQTIATILFLGFLSGYACTLRKQNHFLQHQARLKKQCTIQGKVCAINNNNPSHKQITLHTTSITMYKKHHKIYKKIAIFTSNKDLIEVGSIIRIKNIKLSQPANKSFQLYLLKEDIWTTAHQNNLQFSIVTPANKLQRQLNKISFTLTHTIQQKLTQAAACLYKYIILGIKDKNALAQKFKSQFQLWGTSHQLARSGLHVVMLIGALMLLLAIIPISYTTKLIVTGALLFIYALITPHSIAFLRAIYMYFAYLICKITKTPTLSIHIITCTALFVLIQNPFQLFALDFQLSFIATIIIILFFQRLQALENIAS